ncbi:threonine aldolase family protein [Planomicrobium okeanokoites]|uniref:threonine aldolase family protein n=1 Tax=Planomicrobium okeanokoites TaxID=244 RepID=UPI002491CBA6|nr:aminotransferase class I/II-fold pyridoxal phosphate-dependent enzyme [Planomicrobium okeanokoites]
MNTMEVLKDSFDNTDYQLAGHGPRNVKVLRQAFQEIDDEVKSDIYGTGAAINDSEDKMASFLGKEKAVFFPSGTMAQQIALRIWTDVKGSPKVAYHPLSHLEIHEEDGLKKLHGIETVLLTDKDSVIQLEDVKSMPADVACVLLELPQREIGGQLPDFETLTAISQYCQEKDIRLHLDGARILETLPYYQKSVGEICSLFDSVYISMYKGIGGIAGAVLAGDDDFIKDSKVWKKRHGGDLISLYPYIFTADYYFELRKDKMADYYEAAKELAAKYNSCTGIATLPEIPVSNMFHVHIGRPREQAAEMLAGVQRESGIGLSGYVREIDQGNCYFEVSLGDAYSDVPKEKIDTAFHLLDEKMKGE